MRSWFVLPPADFGGLFAGFQREAFRLEQLPSYRVAEEAAELAAYASGGPPPVSVGGETDWRRLLSEGRTRGQRFGRVHVVSSPLSAYLRYECEWGYAYNVALGEDVGILDLSEVDYPNALPPWDFWLFDERVGVRMHYTPDGGFEGAELVAAAAVDQLVQWQGELAAAAVPFAGYWAAHPEYHRRA